MSFLNSILTVVFLQLKMVEIQSMANPITASTAMTKITIPNNLKIIVQI